MRLKTQASRCSPPRGVDHAGDLDGVPVGEHGPLEPVLPVAVLVGGRAGLRVNVLGDVDVVEGVPVERQGDVDGGALGVGPLVVVRADQDVGGQHHEAAGGIPRGLARQTHLAL